jgi:hypothetical protein
MTMQLIHLAAAATLPLLLAQQAGEKAQPGILKLDGPSRAKALAALAAMVILGFGLIALVWLGGRWARRYMDSAPHGPRDVERDDWTQRSDHDSPTFPPPD